MCAHMGRGSPIHDLFSPRGKKEMPCGPRQTQKPCIGEGYTASVLSVLLLGGSVQLGFGRIPSALVVKTWTLS